MNAPLHAALKTNPDLAQIAGSGYRCKCKFCGTPIRHAMADLGMSPVANAYRKPEDLDKMEPFYPLRALVCESCLLVQAQEFETAEQLFTADYAYFASYSESWLAHAKRYVDDMTDRFMLGASSKVVEIAANDGYLLRWFLPKGVPVLGVEPTAGTAAACAELGIPVEVKFFGCETARALKAAGHAADLMPANNVVAHVPDINDFVGGFKILLKPTGVATFEFHHVMNLMKFNQFDTIYHEHYYYHSLHTFKNILAKHGLKVFDVEELGTHGGSLRVYAQHDDTGIHPVSDRVPDLLAREAEFGLTSLDRYLEFNEQVKAMKRRFLSFLIEAKNAGKTIAAYGAPAKGNTLLNYAGVKTDFIDYTVDKNPHKQGTYLPGVQIPIESPDRIFETKPDYLLILPWNLRKEISEQMSAIREWGGQFLVLIPEVEAF
ncbi:MAG: class I SAM-dependent methyltransferase [Burkholderiaceae bacterium]